MKEILRNWFKMMYQENIDEAYMAISNERLWQKGADTPEEAVMHEENIAILEEWIEELEEKLKEVG